MNKQELTEAVAATTGLGFTEAAAAVSAVLVHVKKALTSGDSVALQGFGTFSTYEKAATTGRNPNTGERIAIPAKRVAKFAPGEDLKKAVQGVAVTA